MNIISAIRLGLRNRFIRFYTDDLVKISRIRQSNRNFVHKRPQSLSLSSSQKQEILSFWKPYRNINQYLKWFAFYNSSCDNQSQLKRYIPDPVFFSDIDRFFTSPRRCESLDDKNLYDLYLHDVKMPRTIIRKINGELFDKCYLPISIDEALKKCADAGQIVCKEALSSYGGHGVRFFDFSSDTTLGEFKECLNIYVNVNIQEAIQQHECLNRIHENSINTIRIMSLLFNSSVHILSSVLRMGCNGSRVDNASSGGIVCGIHTDGTLKKYAYDTTGQRYSQHPQGATFMGTQITGYDKCYELVKTLAGRFCTVSNLISWDFAIGEDGEPILIEVNLTYGEVDFHQLCNGPIFGDLTEKILSKVYRSNI